MSKEIALKGAFEVNAGIVPMKAIKEYTKIFPYSVEQYQKDLETPPEEMNTFTELMKSAHDYAMGITDPRCLNWVQVTFIWY